VHPCRPAADHLDIASTRRLAAFDDTDDARAAKTGRDFVAAEFPQAIRHECRGAMHIVEQFGMFVDIPAPGLNIGLQIGDTVDDGHGKSSSRFVRCVLSSTRPRSAQHSPAIDRGRHGRAEAQSAGSRWMSTPLTE
jgi:hypothetical protein